MPKDFKASQIRTSALVASGTQSGKPGILLYSASDASNFEGGYQADMLTNVGTDVFFFVSGSKNNRTGISLFGGDVVVSGTLYMERLIAEVDLSTTSSSAISGSALSPDIAPLKIKGLCIIISFTSEYRGATYFENISEVLLYSSLT